MNYTETLDFLYSKLPMFTRIGEAALKKDLHNTIALCEKLGNPQDKFNSIHVAGTNGKGSTSHMLAAILQKAGYKTGLYTSPHLKDFRERIRINGNMIPESFVSNFVAEQQSTIAAIEPSFFEVTVAMAFAYFAEEQVDIAIIEVGLGGRLDSTNIIHPLLSVVTNISFDHTNILGNSIEEIAYEKAGIIKRHVPAVIGEREAPSDQVFLDKASQVEAELEFASDVLQSTQVHLEGDLLTMNIYQGDALVFENLQLDLTGTYQLKNILPVLMSVFKLRAAGFTIEDSAIYDGLKAVKLMTGLQGRWQTIALAPTIICDTGHNPAGIRLVMENIQASKHEKLHMVIGMVKDKDISSVLTLLPKDAQYYFTQPKLERALMATVLKEQAEAFSLHGEAFSDVRSALASAKAHAAVEDLIFVGGSTFTVAEVI
jgi:dihydrofolate synthase/folylpolyglutamate synthase